MVRWGVSFGLFARSVPLKYRSPAQKCSSDRFVLSDSYRVTVLRLYRTLHTHPGPHRLWPVCPSQDFLARCMTVSEAVTIRHPVSRLRRKPPSTYFSE